MSRDEHDAQQFGIYRSILPKPGGHEQLQNFRHTICPPGNVPYLVDNL